MASSPPPAGALRALLAFMVTGGLSLTLIRAAHGAAVEALTPPPLVDELVGAVVVAIGAAAAAVLWTGCSLLLLGAVGRAIGRPWRWCDRASTHLTPALLRRAVAVTVSTGLGLTVIAGAAGATEIDVSWTPTHESSESAGTAPGADPITDAPAASVGLPPDDGATPDEEADAPVVPREPAAPPASPITSTAAPGTLVAAAATTPAPGAPPGDDAGPAGEDLQVVVRPGDSLWGIARAHLDDPTDAEIAAQWPRWYAANRALIGADPDLIHPGQVLTAPIAEES